MPTVATTAWGAINQEKGTLRDMFVTLWGDGELAISAVNAPENRFLPFFQGGGQLADTVWLLGRWGPGLLRGLRNVVKFPSNIPLFRALVRLERPIERGGHPGNWCPG